MDVRTPQLIRSMRKFIPQHLQEQCEDKGTPEVKTPMTRSRRKSMTIKSEKKSMKKKSKRRLLSMCDDAFSVEILTEPVNLQKELILDDKKVLQKCFVNLESLTQNQLNLVKTVTSPLVKIKNAIQTSKVVENDLKSCNTNEEPEVEDKLSADKSTVEIDRNNPERTINLTFSFSDDENPKNNDTTFTASPPAIFNATDIPKQDDSKRSSISKRLSKSMKPLKSKLSKSSTINKSSRLSSMASSRTPKLSGSRAIQLYEFLTGEPFGNKLQDNDERSDIIGSPPPSSSTPKPLKNRVISSVLKSTLKKHSVTFADLPSSSKNDDMNCSKVSRGKMPNFALIHKKQFDKMENISDYKQRKVDRAKILLSGAKPLNNSSTVLTPKNKCVKKELINSFNRNDDKIESSIPNTEDFVLLPNTPTTTGAKPKVVVPIKPVLRINTEDQKKNITVRRKNVRIDVTPTKSSDSDKSGFAIRKTPFKENVRREGSPHIAKSVSTLNFVQINKENLKSNSKNVKQSSVSSLKPVQETTKQKNVHTRFGFKAPLKNKKEDVVKAVINKSRMPTTKDNMEDKRAVIKGVRSNRRFDLLMKMRLNK